MEWGTKLRGLLIAGASMAAVASTSFSKKDALPKNPAEKLTEVLTTHFGNDSVHSEAVFILPFVDHRTTLPDNELIAVQQAKEAAYDIQRAFEAQGLPAFMMYDTSHAQVRVEDITRKVDSLQKLYHFNAVTIVNLSHGQLYNWQKNIYYNDTAIAKTVWQKDSAAISHNTTIGEGYSTSTRALYADMAAAGHFKRMDVATFSCYAGAMTQQEIDIAQPKGSVFVALSGDGQVNYTTTQTGFAEKLTAQSIQLGKIDADYLLAQIMVENVRNHKTDIVIATSGQNNKTIFRTAKNMTDASAANKDQIAQMQTLSGIVKKPQP